MTAQLTSAVKLRRRFLETLHTGWEARPGRDDYFHMQQISDKTRSGAKVDPALVGGVINSLLSEKLIVAVGQGNDIAVRITDEGRQHLYMLREAGRTRWLALIGAITGCLSLLNDAIRLF